MLAIDKERDEHRMLHVCTRQMLEVRNLEVVVVSSNVEWYGCGLEAEGRCVVLFVNSAGKVEG